MTLNGVITIYIQFNPNTSTKPLNITLKTKAHPQKKYTPKTTILNAEQHFSYSSNALYEQKNHIWVMGQQKATIDYVSGSGRSEYFSITSPFTPHKSREGIAKTIIIHRRAVLIWLK